MNFPPGKKRKERNQNLLFEAFAAKTAQNSAIDAALDLV
jgi:hypothetical protein